MPQSPTDTEGEVKPARGYPVLMVIAGGLLLWFGYRPLVDWWTSGPVELDCGYTGIPLLGAGMVWWGIFSWRSETRHTIYERDRQGVRRREREARDQERLRRERALELSDVDNMDGSRFERYVAQLLEHQGYGTLLTRASNDFGVDIIAELGGERYAVQVKRHQDAVSRTAVSDAVAGKDYYSCQRAMVVTNCHFTAGAKLLAGKVGCELVDRETLAGWIEDSRAF